MAVHMDTRAMYEAYEEKMLSPFATLSKDSAKREREIVRCTLRTDFQRDRDRILHCKSFRRLKHKTQVFLSPQGDHYRTRLTHTLEVSQIARTISRALRLNEDLTEAIALGHDLGHTPFGHAGESVLDSLLPGGFAHNEQSLRIVRLLENDGLGLNLTFPVQDGILHHKRSGTPSTLEGYVVSFADRIAYLNHDIDDAVRAQVLHQSEIPTMCTERLGNTHGERINNMILDVVTNSVDSNSIVMSPPIMEAFEKLRDFMFEQVYLDSGAKREEEKAMHVVEALYKHYVKNVSRLPAEYERIAKEEGPERAATDWIACMTDRYAIKEYTKLFVPGEWKDDAYIR